MTVDLNDYLYIKLKDGTVKIKMYSDLAPNHVEQILKLANDGFYNGLSFHRVIDSFMAQGGCPNGTGTGGSGTYLTQEFNNRSHIRGTCSMARSQDPNSASSQFFICLAAAPYLDRNYTVWGEVVEGMEYVDNIKKGDKARNGSVVEPDIMIEVYSQKGQ